MVKNMENEKLMREFIADEFNNDYANSNEEVERYMTQFEKINNKQATWHWPAFLVGGFWMLYRKMLWAFLMFMIVSGAITILGNLLGSAGGVISDILTVALWIGLGFAGNPLYKHYVERHLAESQDPETLRKYGGTTWKYIFIYIGVCLAIGIILAVFAIQYN